MQILRLSTLIAEIEAAQTPDDLRDRFRRIVENLGFAGFGFMDAGAPARGDWPLFFGAVDRRWAEEYKLQRFAFVDPCIQRARRTNTPFRWTDLRLPARRPWSRSGAHLTMEAAREHGFHDGLIVPFHFRDEDGLYYSASAVFYWRDKARSLDRVISEMRAELHLLMIYFMQAAIQLVSRERRGEVPFQAAQTPETIALTDQERAVLQHAYGGLSVAETASKMGLSPNTVETHVRRAMAKLNARTKTQATAMAVALRLVDVI